MSIHLLQYKKLYNNIISNYANNRQIGELILCNKRENVNKKDIQNNMINIKGYLM